MVAAGLAGVLAPAGADAHFVLEAPRNWAEQDSQGQPQKTAPCGQADPQMTAVPTSAVTAFRAPGRRSPSRSTRRPSTRVTTASCSRRRGGAVCPPIPPTTPPGTCDALAIQDPPVFPVLADGMLPAHGPARRSAVVSGQAAGRRHVRELHVAGPRVHVGRGRRQRQLLLSPLRGHLDLRRRNRRRRCGCAESAMRRIIGRRAAGLARLLVAGVQLRNRAAAHGLHGRGGADRRRRRGWMWRRSPGRRRARRFAGRRRAGVARPGGHRAGADRRGLRAGRRRSDRARSLSSRPRPRWAGWPISTARWVCLPAATRCVGGGDAFAGSVGAHRVRAEPAHLRLPPLFAARREPHRGRGVLPRRALRGAGRVRPRTNDFNFYLLAFEPACRAARRAIC